MQLFADLSDAARCLPEADDRGLPRRRRRRRRRDRRRLRHARRRRQPADALPRRRARVPVGPARLVTLCGLATAKYLLLSSRTVGADEALRLGLVNRVRPRRRAPGGGARARRRHRRPPPEAVARLKRMLHEWDDIVGRSAAEGRGQVECSAAARAPFLALILLRQKTPCSLHFEHFSAEGSRGAMTPSPSPTHLLAEDPGLELAAADPTIRPSPPPSRLGEQARPSR